MRSMQTALLLLNFGGPRNLEEVEPFLRELFADHDAIRLPTGRRLQGWLAQRIARRRAPRVMEQYARIGGESPLYATTLRQAEAVGEQLQDRGHELGIFVGMRYTEPSIGRAVDEALAAGATRLICLALYPQYSIATTGSAFNAVVRHLGRQRRKTPSIHFVPAFYRQPGYIEALCDRIGTALDAAPVDAHLLFSAHGLPVSYLRRLRDPYARQIQETVALILQELRSSRGHCPPFQLSWQSRVGPTRWLSPATRTVLSSLGAANVPAVVVAPISFAGDHLETLYEIDIELAEVARAAGMVNFLRVPALDLHPRFVDALCDVLTPALQGEQAPLCERCLLPCPAHHRGRRRCRDCGYALPFWRLDERISGAE